MLLLAHPCFRPFDQLSRLAPMAPGNTFYLIFYQEKEAEEKRLKEEEERNRKEKEEADRKNKEVKQISITL